MAAHNHIKRHLSSARHISSATWLWLYHLDVYPMRTSSFANSSNQDYKRSMFESQASLNPNSDNPLNEFLQRSTIYWWSSHTAD